MTDRVAQLLDKQEITEQLYTYCRSMDRCDHALGYTVFHPDSTACYDGGFESGTGHELVDWILESHKGFESHFHTVANVLITLDGDRAGSEAYGLYSIRLYVDGTLKEVIGRARYLDTWERRGDGVWRIAERYCAGDFSDMRDVAQEFAPNPTGTRDRSDPSYKVLALG